MKTIVLCCLVALVAGSYPVLSQAPAAADAPLCKAPDNTSSLFIESGTSDTYLGQNHDPKFDAISACTCDRGNTYFYESASIRDADAGKRSGQGAWSMSTLTCSTFSIVAEDGTCYEPSEKAGYVDILPFCDAGGCHTYAVPFVGKSTSADITYGPLKDDKGSVFHAPGEQVKDSAGSGVLETAAFVGSDTTHIKAKSISCKSCADAARDPGTCSGNKDGCRLPAGFASLYIAKDTTSSTNGDDASHLIASSKSCSSCDNGDRKFWLGSTAATPKDSIDNNQVAWILDTTSNCPNMCMCDTIDSQNCYVPEDSSKNVRVELTPLCGLRNDTRCFMYAAVYDGWTDSKTGTTYGGVKSTLSGEKWAAPDTQKDTFADAKYLRIATIGCNGCDNLRAYQCVGPAI